ncbi:MAG: response regulator transcription factor [Anaerolineae bacterium]
MSQNSEKSDGQDTRLRVLIADDDVEVRRSTRLMLSMLPDTRVVAMARDGREAVEMAKSLQPDVALIDINMPGMTGMEAIQTLREVSPDLMCIVISVEKDAPTVRQAVHLGVAAYLIKPFTIEELGAVIEKTRAVVIKIRKRKQAEAERRRRQLEAVAEKLVEARRSDEESIAVLESLAAYPDCAERWLRSLAMVYVARREWSKLKELAARLEAQTQ